MPYAVLCNSKTGSHLPWLDCVTYIYKSTNHEHQKPRKSFKMEVFELLQIYGGVARTSAVCVKMVIQYCNLWVKIILTIFNAHSFWRQYHASVPIKPYSPKNPNWYHHNFGLTSTFEAEIQNWYATFLPTAPPQSSYSAPAPLPATPDWPTTAGCGSVPVPPLLGDGESENPFPQYFMAINSCKLWHDFLVFSMHVLVSLLGVLMHHSLLYSESAESAEIWNSRNWLWQSQIYWVV